MNIDGWITLDRKIMLWHFYKDANAFRLFIHLLMNANYEDKIWLGNPIKRGEFISSRKILSTALNLTQSQIRTAENNLKIANTISIKTTNHFAIYSIVNYEEYQKKEKKIANETLEKSPKNLQKIATTNKETKEQNNKEGIKDICSTGLFDELEEQKTPDPILIFFEETFWPNFPKTRRGNREKALEALYRAVKRASLQTIADGFAPYPASAEVKNGYAKGAAAWLNDDRWEADYTGAIAAKINSHVSFEEKAKIATQSGFDKLMKERFGEDYVKESS